MIFIKDDEKEFTNAKHCHICEEELPDKSRDIDYVEKIKGMLKILGLPKCMPLRKTVEKKLNYNEDIPTETFEKKKTDLLLYRPENNDVVVKDNCHFIGRFRGAAHQNCNLQFQKKL